MVFDSVGKTSYTFERSYLGLEEVIKLLHFRVVFIHEPGSYLTYGGRRGDGP